jgi:hypothetical protein
VGRPGHEFLEGDELMPITYPNDGSCDTPKEKLRWLVKAKRKLIKLQNGFAKWYNDGLTQGQYNQFPQRIRNNWSYVPQIDLEIFKDFERNHFRPAMHRWSTQWGIQVAAYLNLPDEWDIDPSDI